MNPQCLLLLLGLPFALSQTCAETVVTTLVYGEPELCGELASNESPQYQCTCLLTQDDEWAQANLNCDKIIAGPFTWDFDTTLLVLYTGCKTLGTAAPTAVTSSPVTISPATSSPITTGPSKAPVSNSPVSMTPSRSPVTNSPLVADKTAAPSQSPSSSTPTLAPSPVPTLAPSTGAPTLAECVITDLLSTFIGILGMLPAGGETCEGVTALFVKLSNTSYVPTQEDFDSANICPCIDVLRETDEGAELDIILASDDLKCSMGFSVLSEELKCLTDTPTTAPSTTTPSSAPITRSPTTPGATFAPTSSPVTTSPTASPLTQAPSKGPTTAPTSVPSYAPTKAISAGSALSPVLALSLGLFGLLFVRR